MLVLATAGRYRLVLHTDEPHPHVHLVVKAVSEQGERLNVRKATLREWRRAFAHHLREQGIAANATERAVRGHSRAHKLDGIYRASKRGESTHMRSRTEAVASELLEGSLRVEPGKATILKTRSEINCGWRVTNQILQTQGERELAAQVDHFFRTMPPPRTDREWLAADLRGRSQVLRPSG